MERGLRCHFLKDAPIHGRIPTNGARERGNQYRGRRVADCYLGHLTARAPQLTP